MSRHLWTLLLGAFVWAFVSGSSGRADDAPPLVEEFLHQGQLAQGEKALTEHLKANPDDHQAQFGLGVLQFLQGVERLSQAYYKHGMANSSSSLRPLRLPVDENPEPAPITYQQTRQIAQTFIDDMERAERTLAKVDSAAAKLPLSFAKIRLDLNGDGKADENETLWRIYAQLNRRAAGAFGHAAAVPPVAVPDDINAAAGESGTPAGGGEILAPPGLGGAEEGEPSQPQAEAKPLESPRDEGSPSIEAVAAIPTASVLEAQQQPLPEAVPVGDDLQAAEPQATLPVAVEDEPEADVDGPPVDAVDLPSARPDLLELAEQTHDFAFALEGADVHWLRGYCQLLAALGNIYLAHDGEALFDAAAHLVFPNAQTRYPFLKKSGAVANELGVADPFASIDAAAAIHLVRLDVAEPKRLVAARGQLLAAIAQTRLAKERLPAETGDGEGTALFGPSGLLAGIKIDRAAIDAWEGLLDDWEALLEGKRLVPFWRGVGQEGVNIKRVFEEPRPFDLVLWVQGTAAAGYLEEGPLANKESWERLVNFFGGDFIGRAQYFNLGSRPHIPWPIEH